MDISKEQLDSLIKELDIEVINPDRRYWLIRAGKEGTFFDEFIKGNFTAIGYGISDFNILNNSSRDELKKIIENSFPEEKQPGHVAGKLYNFFHEIRKGDVIIMPSAGRRKIAFAIIEDEIPYIEESTKCINKDEFDIPNKRRKVFWKKIVKKKFIHPKLILNLFSPHGLSEIVEKEIITLIDTSINDLHFKGENAYLTFRVKQKNSINLNTLTSLMEVLDSVSSEKLSVQMNLNSPGNIIVYGASHIVIASVIGLALFGGNVDVKMSKNFHLKLKTKGLADFINNYLHHRRNTKIQDEELKIKYLETINKLDIDESEKIELIRKKIEE